MVTAVGRAVLSLPAPVARAFLGAPIEREGRVLDAQVQLALLLSKLTGGEPSHVVGVERARRELDLSGVQLAPRTPRLASTAARMFAGCMARVYRPVHASGAGVVFFRARAAWADCSA